MTINNKQKAVLHVAKAKLKPTDTQYRSALVQIADATSSTDLDQGGFEAMMGFFERLGFEPLEPRGLDFGSRPGMASFAQIELIRVLWIEYTNSADEDALNIWILRSFKVSSLRLMSKGNAQKAIAALKQMKRRTA